MILEEFKLTKEKFSYEVEKLYNSGVDMLDSVMTVTDKYKIDLEFVPKLLNENVFHGLQQQALNEKTIKFSSEKKYKNNLLDVL